MWDLADEERDYDSSYWPQWNSQYRPIMGRHQQQRLHQTALTNPPPYTGGGLGRRPLLNENNMPQIPDSFHRAPILQNNFGRRPWMTPEQDLYQDFNEPARPSAITVEYSAGAILCEVRWNAPQIHRQYKTFSYQVDAHGGHTQTMELPQFKTSMRMKTTAGTWYTVEVRACSAGRIIGFGKVEFKAVFTREEMKALHCRAVDYVSGSMHQFEVFYRCKPQPYYDDIKFNRNRVMEKYLKDNNGQAGSSINGVLHGLFFSARLTPSGHLPTHSPFGNIRMIIPATTLFNPLLHRVYFSDFYCNYTTHYVTVVVCVRGSESDLFCERNLIELDPEDNHFLRCVPYPGWNQYQFWINKKVWVEVYYTENVHFDMGRFDQIYATGAGTSKPGGLPHNKFCTICNLYPLLPPSSYGKSGADAHKRPLSVEEEDDFGNKRRRDSEGEYDVVRFNSTFHLLMELEREQLGTEGKNEEPGDSDVIETICSLTDAVVAEIGPTIIVPEHGFVGRPYRPKTPQEPPPAESPEPTKSESGVNEEVVVSEIQSDTTAESRLDDAKDGAAILSAINKENLQSVEGKAVFDHLLAAQQDLDRRCKDLQNLLATIHSSVTTLEKKIQPLRS